MNREELQRREEVEYTIRFFKHHFGLVPKLESLPTNSRPDVRLNFEGKRIGIELTRAVDEAQAVFDSFAGHLLNAARAEYARLGGFRGTVMVSLRPQFDTKGLRGRALGVELAQSVAALWREPVGTTMIQGEQLSPAVRQAVSQVQALPQDGEGPTSWLSPVAAWVQGITVDRLQPIINRKGEELSAYRQMNCDEYWLLIYARTGKAAEMFDEADGFDGGTLTSPFDRTFFYDVWRSKELALT